MSDIKDKSLLDSDSNNPPKKKSRVKRRSQDVIALFTPSDNCKENIETYIENAKKLHRAMFNYGVKWNTYTWNIRGFESTTRLRDVTNDANIIFTQSNGLKPRQKVAKDDEIPFMEPFLSFAKAYITHSHKVKPKTHDTHMVTMRALRYVYEVLPDKSNP